MHHDWRNYQNGCQYLDGNSFEIAGFGPVADLFYGVMISFTLSRGIDFRMNKDMWHGLE